MASISPQILRLVNERDGRTCQRCNYNSSNSSIKIEGELFPLPEGHTNKINIHHVLPKQYGGTDDPANLITLCTMCHMQRHIELQGTYFKNSLRQFYEIMLAKIRSIFKAEYQHLNYALRMLTGSDQFRYPQREIIESILSGNDTLVVMPTGTGKSVCYQLPGLILDGQTLVISPLKSLMKDQVEGLQSRFATATYINSDLGKSEITTRIELIKQNLFKFVYLTPERFFNKANKYEINASNPLLRNYNLLAIDEAHCIEKWGRAFRTAYSQLGTLRSQLNNVPTVVLTASASKKTQNEILNSLKMRDAKVFVTGFYRPEIRLNVMQVKNAEQKKLFINNYISSNAREKTLIFVPTIKVGQELQIYLSKYYKVDFYHSKLSISQKRKIHDEFSGNIQPESKILISTSAFGMGINIRNIRSIIHYSIPQNLEDYYQQVGRAGRDGYSAEGVLLYAEGDEEMINYINSKSLENSDKTTEEKREIYEIQWKELQLMRGYVFSVNKWRYILDYFGDTSTQNVNTKAFEYWWIILIALLLLFATIH